MAKLRIGGKEFPLVMTVGVLDQMAVKGYNVQDVPKFFSDKAHSMETDMDNGIEFLQMLMFAGQESAQGREGVTEPVELPTAHQLRLLLTPGQVWGLCDAAILDSLKRTVEAAPGKN